MTYLTYQEYKAYGGTLPETEFCGAEYEARTRVDYYTFDRLVNDAEISERVKRAMYKIIGLIGDYNAYMDRVSDMDNPIITSASNDGVTESLGGYAGATSMSDAKLMSERLDRDIYAVIRRYLGGECNQKGEMLLYRGVYK